MKIEDSPQSSSMVDALFQNAGKFSNPQMINTPTHANNLFSI